MDRGSIKCSSQKINANIIQNESCKQPMNRPSLMWPKNNQQTSCNVLCYLQQSMHNVWTYLPEEIKCQNNLKWSRPQHVEESGKIHEPLCVHRHQVDYLSHRRWALGSISYHKRLQNNDLGGGRDNFTQHCNKIIFCGAVLYLLRKSAMHKNFVDTFL